MDWVPPLMIDGAIYSFVSLGILVTFVWGKIADLTPDASFTWGALGAWFATTQLHLPGPALFAFGMAFGAMAGLATYSIARLGIPYLMASLIVVGLSYSLSWNAIQGPLSTIDQSFSPYNHLGAVWDMVWSVSLLIIVSGLLLQLAISQFGLLVRASSENPNSTPDSERWKKRSTFTVLILGNALVGLAGGMFAAHSYFVEINMGSGMLISGLGAFMLGWAALGFRNAVPAMIFGAILGALVLRSILTLALANDVPGEWFRALSSAAILACLIFARSGAKNVFRELRL